MKILFLLTQDLDSPSGLGRYWPLGRELVRLGHSVTIAALHSNYSAVPYKRYQEEGVNILYVAPMHVRKRGNIKSYFSMPLLIWILVRATIALSWATLKTPADIIHIGKSHPMNGLAGLLGKYLLGRRVWLDCDDYEASSNRFGAPWQQKIMAAFERWLPRHVDFITTHTIFNSLRLQALGIPQEKIFYLSNGVDRQRLILFDPQKITILRQDLNLIGKKVVTFIGSLSLASHAIDLLINGFILVHQAQPESVLLLVGGGEDYPKLVDMAQNLGIAGATVFLGRVSPQDVSQYYAVSDISVDPVFDDDSSRGRSPLKLFESWACGVPFVTSDVGDRRFLLGDPPAGFLTTPGDPQALAEAILQILNDPTLAETFRERGFERVKPYFWDQLAAKLDRLYQI